ncbi:MAG TPA: hypothetical protein VK498_11615 [Ferruginibacter sp.]|nr:hypothetical protein [Ferruginibacter sp.]
MKYIFFNSLFLLYSLFSTGGIGDKILQNSFYAALSSESMDNINAQLFILKGSALVDKEAYEGALLMKKAGLIKGAKEKLDLFKAGRLKLESSISKNNSNIEYRFLRLIIQEHAPKILKYRSDIEPDSRLIRSNFNNLPTALQRLILDYSKRSKALKLS